MEHPFNTINDYYMCFVDRDTIREVSTLSQKILYYPQICNSFILPTIVLSLNVVIVL